MEGAPKLHNSRNFVELSEDSLVPVELTGDPFRLETTAYHVKIGFALYLADLVELLLARFQFTDGLVDHLLGNPVFDQRPSILDVHTFFDDGLLQRFRGSRNRLYEISHVVDAEFFRDDSLDHKATGLLVRNPRDLCENLRGHALRNLVFVSDLFRGDLAFNKPGLVFHLLAELSSQLFIVTKCPALPEIPDCIFLL